MFADPGHRGLDQRGGGGVGGGPFFENLFVIFQILDRRAAGRIGVLEKVRRLDGVDQVEDGGIEVLAVGDVPGQPFAAEEGDLQGLVEKPVLAEALRAMIGTTGTPRSSASLSALISIPRSRATSIIFRAMTSGTPSSRNWQVR